MKKTTWISLSFVATILIVALGFCIKQYYHFGVSNFKSIDGNSHAYHVYPETTTDSLMAEMLEDYEMASDLAWCLHCRYLKYNQPKPGHYRFAEKISNRDVIRRLQLGEETPIKLSFTQSIRTREQLAGHMGKKLLLDSADVIQRLNDKEYMAHFGLTPETAVCLFIPNTYEVYWTMDADQLFTRMHKEYQRFWNESRRAKAEKLGLSPSSNIPHMC